jgi:diketogulonate reductase-like aldo/keto reductase
MTGIPRLRFRDGNSIPQLEFGIWQVPPTVAAEAVKSAFQVV